MGDYWRGTLMALSTAFIWGPTGAIAKMITSTGLSQISVVAYRAVVISFVVACWLWATRGMSAFRVPKRMLGVYGSLGLLTIIFNATGFMMACVYLSVPQVLMLGYTSPIVTMAGSSLLTRERPSPIQVMSGFLVLLGLYVGFVMGRDADASISLVGLAWGSLSVIGASGQALLSRRVSKMALPDPLLQLFFSHLFGGFLLITARTLLTGWPDLAALTLRGFVLIQYPALMSGLLGYGLLFSALRLIPAHLVTLICTLEIVFALMMTPLLVRQIPTMNEIAGCAVILFAVACSVATRKSISPDLSGA
ncbi:MAG: DMT family transporter [Synergistales bacterium]|jgi:drug/metabolite transporter (DMT)-like permease